MCGLLASFFAVIALPVGFAIPRTALPGKVYDLVRMILRCFDGLRICTKNHLEKCRSPLAVSTLQRKCVDRLEGPNLKFKEAWVWPLISTSVRMEAVK